MSVWLEGSAIPHSGKNLNEKQMVVGTRQAGAQGFRLEECVQFEMVPRAKWRWISHRQLDKSGVQTGSGKLGQENRSGQHREQGVPSTGRDAR